MLLHTTHHYSILSIYYIDYFVFFFFFQAEDGIRDVAVTGVQTCALPISSSIRKFLPGKSCGTTASTAHMRGSINSPNPFVRHSWSAGTSGITIPSARFKIGRASCRERV